MTDARVLAPFGKTIVQAARAAEAKNAAEAVAKKAAANGLIHDPKTVRMLPRPSAAEGVAEGPNFGGQYSVKGGEGMVRPSGVAEGPNFGGQYSVKGGEGMVRPSGLAEGPDFGGPFTARGETLAGQGAPSKALVPVRPAVEPPPNFTMVNPPGTSVAPRASTDIARFLEEADAAAAKSGAAAARWMPGNLPAAFRAAAPSAVVAAAPAAAVLLANDRGRPVGPAQGSNEHISDEDYHRLAEAQIKRWSDENTADANSREYSDSMSYSTPAARPAVAAATRAVTPPPRPVAVAPVQQRDVPPGLMDRIFNGGNYQSNGRLVSTPTDGAPINWGDNDRASDFFRADRELQARRGAGEDMGFARGGMPTAHEQALHKAMHIIHHLVTRR